MSDTIFHAGCVKCGVSYSNFGKRDGSLRAAGSASSAVEEAGEADDAMPPPVLQSSSPSQRTRQRRNSERFKNGR